MTLILGDVIHATGAAVFRYSRDGQLRSDDLSPADLERELGVVTADSRTVREHDVFVALRGERVDGHDFVAPALDAGARAAVVSDGMDIRDLAFGAVHGRNARGAAYVLLVPDPLTALHQLAAYWRDRHTLDVVGVTGSIGKTTTKEIIASVLGSRWPVLKNRGNRNTEIGLPLTLLDLRRDHRAAVLEMGMYGLGDIALLCRIARPRIGVVTNVAPVHLERMSTIDRIATAKSELVASLPADGLSVLNGDDVWTRAMAETSGLARSVLVGLAPDCDYRASDISTHGLEGISFTVHADGRDVAMRTRVPGRHVIHAFLAAIAVARELGMTWQEIQGAVAGATLEERQRMVRLRSDVLLIDDRYNAAPQSMLAALELLAAAPGKKLAVLGDMLELGPDEETSHREVGKHVATVADWLVLRGQRCEWIADAAMNAGLDSERIVMAKSNTAAFEAIRHITSLPVRSDQLVTSSTGQAVASTSVSLPTMPSGELQCEQLSETRWTVLIKGSRGMEMEEIVKQLTTANVHEGGEA